MRRNTYTGQRKWEKEMEEIKTITLGFSPCPNDTFIFNGLVNGLAHLPGHAIHEQLHDVETLNQMAFKSVLDVSKLSFFAWLMVKDRYRLLNSGGALGFGCGPVVVAKKALAHGDMAQCRIVLPGEWTTAHLLFRMWAPQARERRFAPYDRIFDAILSDQADCGVIIHESRFTFQHLGLHQVVDLGAWWEDLTGLPIPLGCIAAHKRIGVDSAEQVDEAIRRSIVLARQDPEATLPYVRTHAQEMTPEVLDAHIHTYVNEFSLDLGDSGRSAVAVLEEKARKTGIIP
ncbi:MAG: 1,4-dihydroxy-6-naphthoate synthase [Desulfobacteraceae bacterium]